MINHLMIRSFLTLSKTLNFSEAARALYLSQQAVSKHIAKLESDLDCKLFVREPGKIQLTEAGEIYVEVFSQYVERMHDAAFRVKSLSSNNPKRIRIAYWEYSDLNSFLGDTIRAFSEKYPDVTLEYIHEKTEVLPDLLAENKTDFIITIRQDIDLPKTVSSHVLTSSKELLVVSKDHPLATAGTTYRSFLQEPVILYVPDGISPSYLIRHPLRLGFSERSIATTGNLLAAAAAIDMCQGVMISIEHSRIMKMGTYIGYPTGTIVDIVISNDRSNPNPYLPLFLNMLNK